MLKVQLPPGHTKAIDTTSLSALCGERYLDNMTIDVCLLRYQWESNESDGSPSLYFPVTTWDWVGTGDLEYLATQLQEYVVISKADVASIAQILVPVHLSGCHWGLVYVDL